MDFTTAAQLLALCQEGSVTLGEAMLRREMDLTGASREEIMARLERSLEIMEQAAAAALAAPQKTMGGLIGGEAIALEARREAGKAVCGPLLARSAAIAMGTLEVNASMGLIVAAPTAGSCGVLPGALLGQAEAFGFKREALLEGLLTASAVGYLIARNATIAGAEGGCQAEVGTASAMAAAAIAGLHGGSPEQCLWAAGTALVNLMGLVCDPIGGLVESPCQGRNAIGAAGALVAAETALAGIPSPAPLDEVIAAMYAVGRALPGELRETALGGIAAAPSACARCHGC
ncbi:MAG: L-serine ammonia-lyase, iron-sulfur-dependent, subunit alpha [Angelakisella sp.]|jgi:L-serine dehydratase|nr:L-serine ammonia-lyase, iron-sulfur-dependent, subunit alpha [Angelakisella sp.]